ncbi:MAG: hypothetical protein IJO74_04655 [Clostridia bacterium]|nr:hypothetical protein [Clostridia bacterium]
MKKYIKNLWDDPVKRDWCLFAVMTFVFTFALYAGSTSRGFISTFPIFFFAATGVFLFYRNLKNSLLMTALLSLCVSLGDSSGYNSVAEYTPSMSQSVVKVVFFVFSAVLAYYCAGLIKRKKLWCIIGAVVVFAVYLAVFNSVFGNIFDAVKNQNNVRAYLSENYPLQETETMRTNYNFKTRTYETTITFKEKDRNYYGEERIVLEKNYDGYFLYAKQAVFEMGSSVITAAVREGGLDCAFDIAYLPFEEMPEKKMFDLGGEYQKLFPYLSYEIIITDDVKDIEEFEEVCRSFVLSLEDRAEYRSIRFYGGEKYGLLYQLDASENGITGVKPFDKDQYIDSHR